MIKVNENAPAKINIIRKNFFVKPTTQQVAAVHKKFVSLGTKAQSDCVIIITIVFGKTIYLINHN